MMRSLGRPPQQCIWHTGRTYPSLPTCWWLAGQLLCWSSMQRTSLHQCWELLPGLHTQECGSTHVLLLGSSSGARSRPACRALKTKATGSTCLGLLCMHPKQHNFKLSQVCVYVQQQQHC
jgi:hypothetical protein